VTETILPLHDFHTSAFTHVTRCIIVYCGEPCLFTTAWGTVTEKPSGE